MAFTDKHRKILWGRAAGCCSVCRRPLTHDETDTDPAAVIGIEAHIISGQVGGPRYRPLSQQEVDHYNNIILLCANHHVRVDQQPGLYTESKLREIKAAHEKWVKDHQLANQSLRLRDAKPGVPILLYLASNGGDVMAVVGGSDAFQYEKPNDLAEDEGELISSFLQELQDWGDIWDDIGPAGQIRAELSIGRDVAELHQAGFVIHVGRRHQVLEGGLGSPSALETGVVVIHRLADQQAEKEILFGVGTR